MPEGPSDEEVLRTATESRSVLSPTPRGECARARVTTIAVRRRQTRGSNTRRDQIAAALHASEIGACLPRALRQDVFKSSPKPMRSRQLRKQSPTASAHGCIASAISCRILSAMFIASSMPRYLQCCDEPSQFFDLPAEPHLGLRTALTLPLPPPPQ